MRGSVVKWGGVERGEVEEARGRRVHTFSS